MDLFDLEMRRLRILRTTQQEERESKKLKAEAARKKKEEEEMRQQLKTMTARKTFEDTDEIIYQDKMKSVVKAMQDATKTTTTDLVTETTTKVLATYQSKSKLNYATLMLLIIAFSTTF